LKKRPSRLSENLAPYLANESGGVTKFSISLPNDLVEEVRRTAKERRTSVSATIGAALRRALEEERRGLDVTESGSVSAADATDLAAFRGHSLGGLVDEALDEWLASRGIRLSPVRDDDWRRRLEAFVERRRALAGERGWTADEVQSDVDAAVTEVREARAARRR
jgi:Arc/MetJ-type ribon-helix-helix transcriptional regulator